MDLAPFERDLLDTIPVGHLGLTDGDGHPRVLPITFALHDGAVWSAVDHKPKSRPAGELARVRWLRERPAAALTVDRYDDDWERLAWVQLLGTVSILGAPGNPGPVEALAERYPQYRSHPPAGPLLRLGVERVVSWSV